MALFTAVLLSWGRWTGDSEKRPLGFPMMEAYVLDFLLYSCQARMKSTGRHNQGQLVIEEVFSSRPWELMLDDRVACRRGQAYLLAEGTVSMLYLYP